MASTPAPTATPAFRRNRVLLSLYGNGLLLAAIGVAFNLFFLVAGIQPGPDQLADFTIAISWVAALVLPILGAIATSFSLGLYRMLGEIEQATRFSLEQGDRFWRLTSAFHVRATTLSASSWVISALVMGWWALRQKLAPADVVVLISIGAMLIGSSTSVGFYLRSRAIFRPVLAHVYLRLCPDFVPYKRSTISWKMYFIFAFTCLVFAIALGTQAFLWRNVGGLETALAAGRERIALLAQELAAAPTPPTLSRESHLVFSLRPFVIGPDGKPTSGDLAAPELDFIKSCPRLLGRWRWEQDYPFRAFLARDLFTRITPFSGQARYLDPTAAFAGMERDQRWVLLDVEPLSGGRRPGVVVEWRRPGMFGEGPGSIPALALALFVIGCAAIGLLWAAWVADDLGGPIQKIKLEVERQLQTGSGRLVVETDDEIGEVAGAFNRMKDRLDVQRRINEATLLGVRAAVTRLGAVMNQISQVVVEQASGSSEHAVSLQEITTTSEQIAATLRSIAESAKGVDEVAGKTLSSCHQGQANLTDGAGGIDQAVARARQVAERMLFFQEQTNRIEGILGFIRNISSKMNIIALNASIEASALGEIGDRFAIVAQQMRELAEQTGTGAKEIQVIFDDLQKATGAAIIATEETEKQVTKARDLTERASEDFQSIVHWAGETARAAQEISLSSNQQTTATDHLATALTEIQEVAAKIAEAARALETSVGELENISDELKRLMAERDLAGSVEEKSDNDQ